MPETAEALDPDELTSVEDEKFDRIYPAQIRELSSVFWTPVAVAAEAAKLLVTTHSSLGYRLRAREVLSRCGVA